MYDSGVDTVDRAGLIARAGDAPHYVAVVRTAPQLANHLDDPAWVVEFVGERPDAVVGESWIDATCIVIDREPVFYATGPRRDLHTGLIIRGYYATATPPDRSLPPLAP